MGVLVGQRHESPHSAAAAPVPEYEPIDVLPPVVSTATQPPC